MALLRHSRRMLLALLGLASIAAALLYLQGDAWIDPSVPGSEAGSDWGIIRLWSQWSIFAGCLAMLAAFAPKRLQTPAEAVMTVALIALQVIPLLLWLAVMIFIPIYGVKGILLHAAILGIAAAAIAAARREQQRISEGPESRVSEP